MRILCIRYYNDIVKKKKKGNKKMKEKMISKVVKKLGDNMITCVENSKLPIISLPIVFHEIERPECLKKMDMEKEDKR